MGKPGIRAVVRGLALLSLAALATWLMRAETDRILCEQTRRTADGLRAAISPMLAQGSARADYVALHSLISMPDLAGIEIYSLEGRRVWSVGESLEIVGYRLGQDQSLTHIAEEGARYEIYWPAQVLGTRAGLALRLDTGWQDSLRRRVTQYAFIVSLGFVFLVAGVVPDRRRAVHRPGRRRRAE